MQTLSHPVNSPVSLCLFSHFKKVLRATPICPAAARPTPLIPDDFVIASQAVDRFHCLCNLRRNPV
jgi:hypothetical protein